MPGQPLFAHSNVKPITNPVVIAKKICLLIPRVTANTIRATTSSSKLGFQPQFVEPFPFGIDELKFLVYNTH